eukprot:TRINITY_DN102214_c0_g1_i1.p2 TRINITY_DN102214_c0_g1~~TRINITY_DN102214_c0_g1_i1.p2  ORF type:complete len:179 (+),score=36.96 TRINITY_DN102214_c0_g1_i1:84-620(+)
MYMRGLQTCVGAFVFSSEVRHVAGITRIPEEFNVEKDFPEKEKWRKTQPLIKCDLCKLVVGHTFDTVGETTNEDAVYDKVDAICDVEELYNSHAIVGEGMTYNIKKAADGEERPELTARWQTHVMKELCDNIIRPNDDEIKLSFLKAKKNKMNRDAFVDDACQRTRLCKKRKGRRTEM